MKKIMSLLTALTLLVSLIALPALAEEKLLIGIAQFAVHPSLDNCREGFLKGLEQAGFKDGENITVEVQNAQADMGMAAQIADNMMAKNVNLICAIATPMAVVSANTADGKVPVIYSAVSDPVAAELADEKGLGDGPVTGTSDTLPVEKQLKAIRALMPEAKTIGILYTVSEVNSNVQLKAYQEKAPEYGFDIEAASINTGADIAIAAPGLVSRVDCLSMLLDNTVVQYLDVVLDEADARGIPVFGSEIEQVRLGCAAAEGIDYAALGVQTGEMAARVLKGEDAAAIPFETIRESKLYINEEKLEKLNLKLPDGMDAVAVR